MPPPLKIGQIVMLIGTDGYMPPIGSIGEVMGEIDSWGDHEVLFPSFPCPNPPGITWEAHSSWLMPIGDWNREKAKEAEVTA